MIIFIPVLVICLNANCEFMLAKNYYTEEAVCRETLDKQKTHMKSLIKKADQGKVEVLEGTCIEADIKAVKGLTT